MESPEFIRVPPEQVVREALQAIAGDRARIIPGWPMWAISMILLLVPFAIVRLGLSQRAKRLRH